MSIFAVVEEGMIPLPKGVTWKPGTIVRIEAVDQESPLLFDALKDFDGMADDMPADLAANINHYVHGHPKG